HDLYREHERGTVGHRQLQASQVTVVSVGGTVARGFAQKVENGHCRSGGLWRCEQIGIEHIPLLASPQGGVAERVTKYREASADREAGVVFRSKTKRKTTPAAAASVASQYLIDDAATPPCGDARRGMALDCNSFTAVTKAKLWCRNQATIYCAFILHFERVAHQCLL